MGKLGELRPNQFITTFGPGSITDALKDSLTILDLKYWDIDSNYDKKIYDTRLAQHLNVQYFYRPIVQSGRGLPAIPFPYYHVCPSCHYLFNIKDNGNFDSDEYVKTGGCVYCPKCKKEGKNVRSTPARLISICQKGHMDDFPWSWWVHKGYSQCDGELILYSVGRSASLSDLFVKCEKCGQKRSLHGVLNNNSANGYRCTGHFAQDPRMTNIKCPEKVAFSQRGASNVYFSVTRSALSLPDWNNPILQIIQQNKQIINNLIKQLNNETQALKLAYNIINIDKDKYSEDDFINAYGKINQKIKTMAQIKEQEYNTIINHELVEKDIKHSTKIFKAEDVDVPTELTKYFSKIIKLHRLREVMALIGYSRLFSIDPEAEPTENSALVWLNSKTDNQEKNEWLPAIEIYGEGIFIEFNNEEIQNWLQDKYVAERCNEFSKLYKQYSSQRGWENQNRDGVYVLLHTLAHGLIKQMSLSSGYNSSSIKERIYCAENMHAILIYTGVADKEGSLGGLVELGTPDKFSALLKDTLDNFMTCTTDPECFDKDPTIDQLNGCACHSCCMISETSCEFGNRMLDRRLVVPLPGKRNLAYFNLSD